MKTKKYYLILAIVTGILYTPALGEVKFYPSAEESSHIVPDPALVEVKLISVTIVPADMVFEKDSFDQEELKAEVEYKLKKAGINVFIPKEGIVYRLPEISELKVRMEMFKFADFEEHVCRIQTFLSRLVNLPAKQSWSFRTDVWKTEPVMQVVSVQDMPAAVTNAVLNQVETFISCYQIATQRPVQPADANDITAVTVPKRVGAVAKPAVAKYNYVASKNSKVFHNPECSSAKRILPKNLVGYNSRNEVLKAGKRPCKICKP